SATFELKNVSANPTCGTARDTVVLTLDQIATVAAGPDLQACELAASHLFAISGSSASAGGMLTWSQIGGVSATISSPSVLHPPTPRSSVRSATFEMKNVSANPTCGTARDTVVLTLDQIATVAAGPDLQACELAASHLFAISGSSASTGGTLTWS